MPSRTSLSKLPTIFWVLTVLALAIWSQVPGYVVGWDLAVYKNAILSLRAHHDPYLDGMAVQRIFHAEAVHAPNAPTPFTYVYSPITLPLLGLIARLPFTLSATLYWLLYAAASAATIWVAYQFIMPFGKRDEARVFALVAPAIIFFPGLLQNDVFFSGNVATILYALVLLAAWRGWRSGEWAWLHIAVLAASCVKAPLLSLVVIPLFCARKQWLPTILTAATGIALFALQPHIWPVLFRNYLDAVELQFSFNRDFSSSPAGLIANALYNVAPYKVVSAVAYLAYAFPLFVVLFILSRKFLAGRLTLRQWVPVLMVGVVLLNPRIMEYDVAPITFFLALVLWRVCAQAATMRRTVLYAAGFFALANVFAYALPWESWRPTECCVLLCVFIAGARMLFREAAAATDITATAV